MVTSTIRYAKPLQQRKMHGGAENAGVKNAGVENAGVDSRGGKCRSGKCRSDNLYDTIR